MSQHPISFYFLDRETNPGGATGTRFGAAFAYIKGNSRQYPYVVANELICGRLAQYLGLPVPGFSAGVENGTTSLLLSRARSFVSFSFVQRYARSAPPAHPGSSRAQECADRFPSETVGALLFDVLVANEDRNEQNIYFRNADPAEFYLFDHSHALFGIEPGKGRKRLRDLRDDPCVQGSPGVGVAPHIFLEPNRTAPEAYREDWAKRIRLLPDWAIADSCKHAYEVCQNDPIFKIGPDDLRDAIEFITWRKQNFETILNKLGNWMT